MIFFSLVCRSPLQPAYAQLGAVQPIRRMGRLWLPKENGVECVIYITAASTGSVLLLGA